MNVLAFDTCLGAVSVALRWRDRGGLWRMAEAYAARTTGHAERLVPMIAEVMGQSGIGYPDIGRIAVTTGPGTFTGVRTGISAARAMALATGAPVVGTTSLEVMAHLANDLPGADRRSPLAVAVDARRGDLYLQVFAGGTCAALSGAMVVAAEAAHAYLPTQGPCRAVGSGAGLLADAVRARGHCLSISGLDLEPSARILAGLGETLPMLDPVTPLYLRAPDAKPQSGKSLPRA